MSSGGENRRQPRLSRRRLLKAAGAAALGTAGTSLGLAGARTPAGAATTRTTIKYLTWWWAEKGRNDAWRALVQKFHSAQNDVRVEEVGFAYSDYFQRVMTQVAGGKLDADVLSCYDELAVRLIKAGQLEPMDPVIDKLGIRSKLTRSEYDLVRKNGRIYGILGTNVPYAVIYNKELYEKEGITKPPSRPEELMEVARKTTHRPNQFGFAGRNTMAEQNGWWQDLTQ